MIIFANAKINLGLFILSKRKDGFHNIASLKYPIPLMDVLEFLPSDEFELKILGKEIGGNIEDNLIFKAYSILKKRHQIGGVRIFLQKNIPTGAGLGGGSSNATFTLKGLNNYFDLNLSSELLKEYAGELGSDCPFFVENTPQLATEKGNILQPFDLNLKGKFLYVIHPDIHVSTAEAYAKVKFAEKEFDWNSLPSLDFDFWKTELKNDFEDSVFDQHPFIGELKMEMYEHGAKYAAMSGSGSSVFGIFTEKPTSLRDELASQFIVQL